MVSRGQDGTRLQMVGNRVSPAFEQYLGASFLVCGITWVWGFLTSEYFPGHASLSLNLVSLVVYIEAASIGAFGLARGAFKGSVRIGMRVGIGAWIVNMTFRFIVFNLASALDGLILFLIGFMIGGTLGGFLGSFIRKSEHN